jgi:hypothetical protein
MVFLFKNRKEDTLWPASQNKKKSHGEGLAKLHQISGWSGRTRSVNYWLTKPPAGVHRQVWRDNFQQGNLPEMQQKI